LLQAFFFKKLRTLKILLNIIRVEMFLKHSFNLFDYNIEEDLIHFYRPSKDPQKVFKNREELGIVILEIKSWEQNLRNIIDSINYTLFDSFSLQVTIEKNVFKTYLIFKIYSLGPFELKFRYKNFKKNFINLKTSNIKILSYQKLEKAYWSILRNGENITKSSLFNKKIHRISSNYYIPTQNDSTISKMFFYLKVFEIENFLKKPNSVEFLLSILFTANIEGSIIFYSKNYGSYFMNSCYFISKTNHVNDLDKFLKSNLKQWKIDPKISFHPKHFGKILLREPIVKKNLVKCKVPPILLANLAQLNNSEKKNNIGQKKNTIMNNQDQLIGKTDNINNLDKLKSIYVRDKLEMILKNFDPIFVKEKKNCYILFENSTFLYFIEKLDETTIQAIIENLSKDLDNGILFFCKNYDYILFNDLIQFDNYNLKTIEMVQNISALESILAKMSIIKKKYLNSSIY
jgi:hypothetical protein